MSRTRFIVIALCCGCGLATAALRGDPLTPPASPPPGGKPAHLQTGLPRPILPVKEFMQAFNKPAYLHLSKDLAKSPTTDEQWADIHTDALKLAEIANLIAIRKVPESARGVVHTHAAALQKSSLGLAEATKGKKYDEAQAAFANVVKTCNACHQALAGDRAPQLKY